MKSYMTRCACGRPIRVLHPKGTEKKPITSCRGCDDS